MNNTTLAQLQIHKHLLVAKTILPCLCGGLGQLHYHTILTLGLQDVGRLGYFMDCPRGHDEVASWRV